MYLTWRVCFPVAIRILWTRQTVNLISESEPSRQTHAHRSFSTQALDCVWEQFLLISLCTIAAAVARCGVLYRQRRITATITGLAFGLEPLCDIGRARVSIVVAKYVVSKADIVPHIVTGDTRCHGIRETMSRGCITRTVQTLSCLYRRHIVKQYCLSTGNGFKHKVENQTVVWTTRAVHGI